MLARRHASRAHTSHLTRKQEELVFAITGREGVSLRTGGVGVREGPPMWVAFSGALGNPCLRCVAVLGADRRLLGFYSLPSRAPADRRRVGTVVR
jgi:hypothetical protein